MRTSPLAGRRAGLLVLVVLLALGVMLELSKPLHRLDLLLYDLHSELFHRPGDDSIRIVAVDERSIQELGRWPWSRRLHGELIHRLSEAGAKVIGLDIVFSEPDMGDPQGDQILAHSLESSGRVVLPVFPGNNPETGLLEERFPLPLFARSAAMLGHIDAELDIDGVSRSVFLMGGVGRPQWPALPLAMLQLDGSIDPGELPGQRSPTTASADHGLWVRDYRTLVPFAGGPNHFPVFSFVDVLRGEVRISELRNKRVLVGATAVGLGDRLSTPTSGSHLLMPGVEYHANLLDMLLHGLAIQPLPWYLQFTLTLLPLSVVVFYSRLSPGRSFVAWSLVVLCVLGATAVLLLLVNRWFAPANSLLVLLLSYPLWLGISLRNALSKSGLEEERSKASYDALEQNLVVVDPESRIEYMSPTAENLTGFQTEQVRGRFLDETLRIVDDHGFTPFDRRLDGSQSKRNSNYYLLNGVGDRRRLVRVKCRQVLDRLGQQHGWIMRFFEDDESPFSVEDKTDEMFFDSLTGLPNRSLLLSQLEQNLRRAERNHNEVAVLFVNIDRFRQVNERFGYPEGDQLLQQVSIRLRESIRESDILARNGGDEFVVVLEELNAKDSVATVAGKIVENLSRPYLLNGQNVSITASVGISVYPRDGKESEVLLGKANLALRSSSAVQDQRFCFFSVELHRQVSERREIARKLTDAAIHNQFQLYYQPQVEIESGHIVAAEALLRWPISGDRFITPAEFIPIAEESGLIHRIGGWVFATASRQLSQWQEEGLGIQRLSVNMSAVQLQRQDVIRDFLLELESYQLDPGGLELEITESAIMHNVERATELLKQFQSRGGSISVDDFGTGYSTFGYLKKLPVNRLKIDRSFVRDMDSFQDDAIITLSIISMAHGLNLEVIAEGVETREQLALLRNQGCDLAQGNLFAEPLPAVAFAALVRNWETHPHYALTM